MTIDETKDELYRLLSDCVNNSYPIRNNTQKGRYRNAVKMAIASLEAWEKVIEELRNEIDIEVFKPNKECGIYCRMYDVEMLIRKHLQEVTE